jgi:hypothetical protein
MKLFIPLVIALLSLSACKKCATCTTTVTQKVTGQQAVTGTTVSEFCGSDLKEADGYHSVSTATVNGYTATITTDIKCQ